MHTDWHYLVGKEGLLSLPPPREATIARQLGYWIGMLVLIIAAIAYVLCHFIVVMIIGIMGGCYFAASIIALFFTSKPQPVQ